ncbi:MAG: hypothetical protein KBA55_14530 [Ruminococcus sp.]|nr:hypothetical protein [Ruminococcus sp.]
MKMLRSLIFREYKLSRGHQLLMLILFLLVAGCMLIPFILGGEDFDPADPENGDIAYLYIFPLIVGVVGGVFAGSNNGVHKADINSGWKRYSISLPPKASQLALADTIYKMGFVVLLGVLTVVFSRIIYDYTGYSTYVFGMNIFLLCAVFFIISDAIYTYILMLAKDEKDAKKYRIIGFFAVAGVLKVLSMFAEKKGKTAMDYSEEKIFKEIAKIAETAASEKVLAVSAVLFAVSIVVYFAVIWRSYERREA